MNEGMLKAKFVAFNLTGAALVLVAYLQGWLDRLVHGHIAVAAGVMEGTSLITRPLAAAGAWRTLGLAWRPNAPRAADYRALAPHLAETCRDPSC